MLPVPCQDNVAMKSVVPFGTLARRFEEKSGLC